MKIRIGYDIVFDCPQPTPMILMLNVHYSRVAQLATPDYLLTDPVVPITGYRDGFGNWCTRIVAPAGLTRVYSDSIIHDSGLPDEIVPHVAEVALQDLPEETLVFLLSSRYCETDRLTEEAWRLFGQTQPGWARVQAICDFVHQHIEFGYQHARRSKSAWEAYNEGAGVCRDYAHLAITFCRCMNIPARYCTGYLATSGFRSPRRRWISPAGSRRFSAAAGIPSTLATIRRASVVCSSRAVATPRTSPSPPPSGLTRCRAFSSAPTRSSSPRPLR